MRTTPSGLLLLAAATLLTAACNDDRPHFLQPPPAFDGHWFLTSAPCTGICPEVIYPSYFLDLERMDDSILVTQHAFCNAIVGGGHGSLEGSLVHLSLDCVPNDLSICPFEVCPEFHGTYDDTRARGELATTTHWPAAGEDCPERTTTTTLLYVLSPGWPNNYCTD
ncbi:MAG: hypothetical protein ACRD6R_04325 [Candidatus Polarisedimenticolia bacterium]